MLMYCCENGKQHRSEQDAAKDLYAGQPDGKQRMGHARLDAAKRLLEQNDIKKLKLVGK